ncbi:Exosome component 10 [Lobulomyces angularis]|nr:Exosome component 10 [Lobulomyces angularis]
MQVDSAVDTEFLIDSLGPAISRFVKATNSLFTSDLNFNRASDPEFAENLNKKSDRILNACNKLLSYVDPTFNMENNFTELEQVVDNFDRVVDWTDSLLEKSDTLIDEISGKGRNYISRHLKQQTSTILTIDLPKSKSSSNVNKRQFIYSQNIRRPQLEFEDKVENSNTPYIRKIKYKPNAKRELSFGLPGSDDISKEMSQHVKTLGITDANSSMYSLPHPYEYEIQNIEYPSQLFTIKNEILYKTFEETPFKFIYKLEQLEEVIPVLMASTEIAVDLEHHDYRSFQGFTCLMQISTRKEDFVIDTLKLRSHLHLLNEPFTNPDIVKVFHGAEMDIQWLQKDFGVYIVNLFDTYHASHSLEMEGHGLAFLLSHYCSVDVDKKYQLADWRIRPIPLEMMTYARSDTHYLLYVFDRMRNELLKRSNPETLNLMMQTLRNSEKTSLNKYEKEIYDAETGKGVSGWRLALQKCGVAFNLEQVQVFKAVHRWRDHIARQEDESIRYVLPQHMLLSIVTTMPIDANGILACCSPVPNLVRINVDDIVAVIENAKLDARQHNKARTAELVKLQQELLEKELEWEEKKKRGPVHTVFSDEKLNSLNEIATRNFTDSHTSLNKREIKFTIIVNLKAKPSLLLMDDESEDGVTNENLLKSIEVRKKMVLVPPTFLEQFNEENTAITNNKEVNSGVKNTVTLEKNNIFVVNDMVQEQKGLGSKRKSDTFEKTEHHSNLGDDIIKNYFIDYEKDNKIAGKKIKQFNYEEETSSFINNKETNTANVDIYDPNNGNAGNSGISRKGVKSGRKSNVVRSMNFVKPQ